MKYVLVLLTAFLITNLAIAQKKEKSAHKIVANSFETNYNNSDYDAIFASFSPSMKQSMPIEKARAFFTELKRQSGNITGRVFDKYEQTYASYKTTFERSTSAINISIDKKGRIQALLVKSYTRDTNQ